MLTKTVVLLLFMMAAIANADSDALFLTPLIEEGEFELAKNLSRVGKLDNFDLLSYSGYLTTNKSANSNMFFWFFPAFENSADAPILLWLSGGPGTSSMFALFYENGPYYVEEDLILRMNNNTWLRKFNIIYVDNPIGTGFSFTDSDDGYSTNLEEIGLNLFEAMQQFFTLFYEYADNDFYICGESFGVKWAPSLAHAIVSNLDKAKMKLAGITLGDGFLDPPTMMRYASFFKNLGLISDYQAAEMTKMEDQILIYLKNEDYLAAADLWMYMVDGDKFHTDRKSFFNEVSGFANKYNFLQAQDLSAHSKQFIKYVERGENKKSLHVEDREFHKHKSVTVVVRKLKGSLMASVKTYVEELLGKYKVLIYNGQLDLLVPWIQTHTCVNKLSWDGAEELANGNRTIWWNEAKTSPKGYVRQAMKFTEAMVRNAGHFVPHDQPVYGFELFDNFINDKPFA